MWRIVVMLHLAVVSSKVSCSPSSPGKVFFSSMNLRNVLHWYPENDTQQNVHFTVQYAIYGDRFEGSGERQVYWRVVQQCKDIEWTWCDLTNETQDLEQGYYARVRAVVKKRSSKWMVTERRFDPKSDTSFGPPLVSFVMEGNSAIFTLRGPMRYQPNNHNPEISMAILYPHMSYNLSVHNTRHNQTQYITFASSQYKYGLMEYDTEYCFSAKTRFLSMPVRCQPSAWDCITTPPDPVIGEMQKMVVGIVIPSLCLCMLGVSGYLLHRSMSAKGQKWPLILELNPQKSPPLTFCPENLNLILISVNNDDLLVTNTGEPDTTFQKPQPPIPILPDLLSYAPQRTSSSPEPDAAVGNDFSEVESMGYGFVGMAHDTEEEEIDRRFGGTRDERWEQQPEGVHLDGFRHRREGTRERIESEEWREESLCSAEGYKPQANPYLSQTSTHGKTNTLKEIKTDMCKFAQAPTSLWVPTFIKEQSQTWRNPLFGKTEVDVMREQEGKMEKEEDRVCPGIFLKKDPNTGVFYIPLLLQIQTEKGREGESMEGMTEMGGMLTGGMDGVLDRGPGEGTERESTSFFPLHHTAH
ncbi:interleukin-20 receptor subunit alpha [Lampris incognitus]|uniref:interleukin-20 receptor subunit alpha n=1 Tax=Lampris incognitus TaxID=2546036 RepID=UPI0024B58F76|nr:interleukin-20 receptor subunit alpha [Lampris incognitus]